MTKTWPPPAPVGELCVRPAVVLDPGTTLADAARELHVHAVSCAVVGVPGRPVAVVTEGDLVRAFAERRSADDPVGGVASPEPLTIGPEADLRAAAAAMVRAASRHLVIARDQRVIGVVSSDDVLAGIVTELGGGRALSPDR